MLQVIFGDDEHTAAEGPYARLMKTRKWLYASSASVWAVCNGLYNESALHEAVKVVSIPAASLKAALTGGLIYLIVQYSLLIIQLATTYDIVLSERFTFRRTDELAKARDLAKQTRLAYKEAIEAFRKDTQQALFNYKDRLNKQLMEYVARQNEIIEMSSSLIKGQHLDVKVFHENSRLNAQIALTRDRLQEVTNHPEVASERIDPLDDQEVKNAAEARDEAERALWELQRQVPSDRPAYKLVERAIDGARIAPPLILAGLGLSAALSH